MVCQALLTDYNSAVPALDGEIERTRTKNLH